MEIQIKSKMYCKKQEAASKQGHARTCARTAAAPLVLVPSCLIRSGPVLSGINNMHPPRTHPAKPRVSNPIAQPKTSAWLSSFVKISGFTWQKSQPSRRERSRGTPFRLMRGRKGLRTSTRAPRSCTGSEWHRYGKPGTNDIVSWGTSSGPIESSSLALLLFLTKAEPESHWGLAFNHWQKRLTFNCEMSQRSYMYENAG